MSLQRDNPVTLHQNDGATRADGWNGSHYQALHRNETKADGVSLPPLKTDSLPPAPASAWRRRISRALFGAALALLLVFGAPGLWNYLQSYESTDDAQIDGHIDPLSSRIDGTVVAVHVEDDDRVSKGELLVEIDPRDCQVAVEQARAHLGVALAQVASAKQDYAGPGEGTRSGCGGLQGAARCPPVRDPARPTGSAAGAIRSVHIRCAR
jgi:hypothetical protein